MIVEWYFLVSLMTGTFDPTTEMGWTKVGDRVLFGKYAGSEVQIEDQPYLIVREVDVMVKL